MTDHSQGSTLVAAACLGYPCIQHSTESECALVPILAALAIAPSLAFAQAPPTPPVESASGSPPTSPGGTQAASPQTSDQPSQQQPLPSVSTFLGNPDPGNIGATLARNGVSLTAIYIGEVLGAVSGASKRSSIYEGRLDLQLDVDMGKLAGLEGLTVHANAYQIHGRGLSGCCLGNLATASGIEATPSTRLYELWAEQTLLGGALAVRAGQLAADTEFLVSQYAGVFVNATFGWPVLTSANQPNGGPAYPLATPGVRLKLTPAEGVVLLAALFNGDPAGPGPDAQRRNAGGTAFRLNDSPLAIAELAWSYNQGKDAGGLPGSVKLGGWHHFGTFSSLSQDTDGRSLLDPASSGIPRRTSGSGGVYAVLDQLVWRLPSSEDGGVGVFARVGGSPTRTSPIDLYADGGITAKGLVPGRPNDTVGFAAAYMRVGAGARALDRDQGAFGTLGFPIRSSETALELTYQAEIIPGFTLQPDLQYVIRPGGRVPDPRRTDGAPIRNATVLGLRATVRY